YFDPASKTYVDNNGKGYTNTNEGVAAMGEKAGADYGSKGEPWSPRSDANKNVERPVSDTAITPGERRLETGQNSTVPGAGQGSFDWYGPPSAQPPPSVAPPPTPVALQSASAEAPESMVAAEAPSGGGPGPAPFEDGFPDSQQATAPEAPPDPAPDPAQAPRPPEVTP